MLTQDRSSRRTSRSRAIRPRLEGLEDRKLLYSTTGGLWTYGSRITYSFVPDGTSIGGVPSALFETMSDRGFAQAAWQNQIRRAAALWQSVANINLVEVSDDGAAIGATGYHGQGDSRIGDIRIGGMSQSSSQLGMAYAAPPYNGGSLAGDIFFNTDQLWQINGTAYDLQTVAIHEFGHALGMSHSEIASACMYAAYNTTKQSLTSDDINGIRSIYAARQHDPYDANGANSTYGTADTITSLIDAATSQLSLSGLEINANTDQDWYYIQVPATHDGSMTVKVQSSGLSSLSPRVMVYDSALTLRGSSAAAYTYGSTVSVTVSGVTAGQGFYIRALAANSGPTGTGAYGLQTNFTTDPQTPIPPPDTTVLEQPDQGGGSSPLTRRWIAKAIREGLIELISTIQLTGYGDMLWIDTATMEREHGHEHHGHDHFADEALAALDTEEEPRFRRGRGQSRQEGADSEAIEEFRAAWEA